jgi:hypothetical protein
MVFQCEEGRDRGVPAMFGGRAAERHRLATVEAVTLVAAGVRDRAALAACLLVSALLRGVYLVHSGISAVYARGTQPNDTRYTAKMHEMHSRIYDGLQRETAGSQRLKAKLPALPVTTHGKWLMRHSGADHSCPSNCAGLISRMKLPSSRALNALVTVRRFTRHFSAASLRLNLIRPLLPLHRFPFLSTPGWRWR